MARVSGHFNVSHVFAAAASFVLLLGAGCHPSISNNEGGANAARLEKQPMKEQESVARLKDLGVQLNYFAGQIEGGFTFPARWTGNVTNFSGVPADLEPLTKLKTLTHVFISGDISDEAMQVIARIGKLESVRLNDTSMSDEGLSKLAKAGRLKSLWLQNVRGVSDVGIDSICDFENLEELVITVPKSGSKVTTLGFRRLDKLTKLQMVDLSAPEISDDVVKKLTGPGKLRSLHLTSAQITNVGAEVLGEISGLETITLAETSITSASMKPLGKLKKLKNLHIIKSKVDNDGLKYVGEFPALEKFSIQYSKITDIGLRHLQKTRIEDLSIRGNLITDEGLILLAPIKTLKRVDDFDTKTTVVGRMQLERALPGIIIGRNRK